LSCSIPPASSPASWWAALKRTVREFREDSLTDWAAALTYNGVLSIFTALLLLVSELCLIGRSATKPLLDNLDALPPGAMRDIVRQAIENLQRSQGGAGILFVVGLLVALWSASRYVAAFMRASNAIWEVEEGRPIWKTVPLRLGITIVMLLALAIAAVAVVVTGPFARWVGGLVGLGKSAVNVWDIAKWPVLFLVLVLMTALLYWASPNVKQPGFRWVTPGCVIAVVLWILASAGFAFYVANFGSYNKTYGSLGGVIIFFVWFWLSNIAILLGAEFDAELERTRQIAAGHPPEQEPFVRPREKA
jgi:membrane protein